MNLWYKIYGNKTKHNQASHIISNLSLTKGKSYV